MVNAQELTDANRAQIEDIVTRKTNIAPEKIVITPIHETQGTEEAEGTEETEGTEKSEEK